MRYILMAILAMFINTSYANIILHGKMLAYLGNEQLRHALEDKPDLNTKDLYQKASAFPNDTYWVTSIPTGEFTYDSKTPVNEKIIMLGSLNRASLLIQAKVILKKSLNNYFSFEFLPSYGENLSTVGGDGFVDFKVVSIKIDDKDSFVLDGTYKNVDGKLFIQLNDSRFKLVSTEYDHVLHLTKSQDIPVTIELKQIK